jgi:parvulin-like peptidyl-prolyl isomerase
MIAEQPVREKIPRVQISNEQSRALMDKIMEEYQQEWYKTLHREAVAQGRERLRQEAIAKGLPVPVFAGVDDG